MATSNKFFQGDISEYPGMPIRFIGSKFNGYEGILIWCGENCAAVRISYENKEMDVIEDYDFMMPLAEWKKSKSETELTLKGAK